MEKAYILSIFSSSIFILMFLYLLYPWTYQNKQQQKQPYAIDGHYIIGNGWPSYTTSPSVTASTNDTTSRPMYAIALTGMHCYFNAFSVKN